VRGFQWKNARDKNEDRSGTLQAHPFVAVWRAGDPSVEKDSPNGTSRAGSRSRLQPHSRGFLAPCLVSGIRAICNQDLPVTHLVCKKCARTGPETFCGKESCPASLPRRVVAGERLCRFLSFRPREGTRPQQAMEPMEVQVQACKMLISLLVLPSDANLQRVSGTGRVDRRLPPETTPTNSEPRPGQDVRRSAWSWFRREKAPRAGTGIVTTSPGMGPVGLHFCTPVKSLRGRRRKGKGLGRARYGLLSIQEGKIAPPNGA